MAEAGRAPVAPEVAEVAEVAEAGGAAGAAAPAAEVWLWLTDLLDPAAAAGAAMLAAAWPRQRGSEDRQAAPGQAPQASAGARRQPAGPVLRLLPLPLALAARWRLQVGSGGQCGAELESALGCFSDAARPRPGSVRIAGVIHTDGGPELPAGLPDRDYKQAEWQALLWAWLHGLRAPVINRPQPARAAAGGSGAWAPGEQALWRQRCARAGLPVWPLAGGAAAALAVPGGEHCGLMVAGDRVVRALGAPGAATAGWTPQACSRLCAVARGAGADWLAVHGAPDASGVWRVSRVGTRPDLRLFGAAGAQALAEWMSRLAAGPRDAGDRTGRAAA